MALIWLLLRHFVSDQPGNGRPDQDQAVRSRRGSRLVRNRRFFRLDPGLTVAAGYDHSAGLKEDGSIVVWGRDCAWPCRGAYMALMLAVNCL